MISQYQGDKPSLDENGAITDFPADSNNSGYMFKYLYLNKRTSDGGTKYVEIMMATKYLSNFWITLEMVLIIKIKLVLTWSSKRVLSNNGKAPTFEITATNFMIQLRIH